MLVFDGVITEIISYCGLYQTMQGKYLLSQMKIKISNNKNRDSSSEPNQP